MSYILDALRKSDEEHRKKGAEPIRSGFSFSRRPVSRRRRTTFSLILISCMLIAGVILGFGYWWSQWDLQRNPVKIEADQPAPQPVPDAKLVTQPGVTAAPVVTAPLPQEEHNPTEPLIEAADQAAAPALSATGGNSAEALPELRFSGHVYSPTPALRMIMINDAVVREGQPISPDLSLLEITETGVVLSFKGAPHEIELF